MADVQRWEDNGGMDGGMMRDPNGDYVEYSDYVAVKDKLETASQELEAVAVNLRAVITEMDKA